MQWTVVIPIKSLPSAKSRLAAATADAQSHALLVEAIRADTASAAQAAEGVARLLRVSDRPIDPDAAGADGDVLVQREPGLNPALREAAEVAAARWPDDGVAVLVGDLPALRPGELAAALASAAGCPRTHVPDAAGTGTTLLTARPGVDLAPSFGAGSAARHAEHSVQLIVEGGLRNDVDTPADLRAAVDLGVGSATAAVLSLGVVARSP